MLRNRREFLIQNREYLIRVRYDRYMISNLPGFMARSPIKTASENDVTQLEDESRDFDDDTLRGETKWKKKTVLRFLSLPLRCISFLSR